MHRYRALFALRDIGSLKDDDDVEIAEFAMPGFMMAHLDQIYGNGGESSESRGGPTRS
jgi:hypothetical protein